MTNGTDVWAKIGANVHREMRDFPPVTVMPSGHKKTDSYTLTFSNDGVIEVVIDSAKHVGGFPSPSLWPHPLCCMTNQHAHRWAVFH